MFTGENAVQSKLLYRGYQLEVRRAPSGWRVGINPRTADLPILSRCEVIALDHHEALLMAKDRVDGVMSLDRNQVEESKLIDCVSSGMTWASRAFAPT